MFGELGHVHKGRMLFGGFPGYTGLVDYAMIEGTGSKQ